MIHNAKVRVDDPAIDGEPPEDLSPRALVVDDAPTVRLYHGEILRRAGFRVDEAVDGYEALERTLFATYDLILVDVNMPRMDGITLVRRLRAAPTGVGCPIVTISTENGDVDTDAALRAGANLYLVKPVSTERLQLIASAVASTQARVRPGVGAP